MFFALWEVLQKGVGLEGPDPHNPPPPPSDQPLYIPQPMSILEHISFILEHAIVFHALYKLYRRRVSSVVEHSSAIPKVHGTIPGPVLYRGHGL